MRKMNLPWHTQYVIDLASITFSFSISYILLEHFNVIDPGKFPFYFVLGITTICKAIVFTYSGIPDKTGFNLSAPNILYILRNSVYAIVLSITCISIWQQVWNPTLLLLYLFDFYFLASLTLGQRYLFSLINNLTTSHNIDADPILIYGANQESSLVINYLLSDPYQQYYPIGFIDDDKEMEGQVFNDYPVFGGYWKLERIINQYSVKHIVIATDQIKPEIYKRIEKLSERKNIDLLFINYSHYGINLKPLPQQKFTKECQSTLFEAVSGIRRN